VLVLGQGSGVLGLLATREGAGRVTCVERSRMLYRMARQLLSANARSLGASSIHLIGRPLHCVAVEGKPQGAPEVKRGD
jgi:predicted RNA methylase